MEILYSNISPEANTTSVTAAISPPSSGPLVGLPASHVVRTWSKMSRLRADAIAIRENLDANEGDGNQWLVVLGLTKKAIEKLAYHDHAIRGVAYRFQWEGTVGILKIMPGFDHDCSTAEFSTAINDQLAAMGIARNDRAWGLSTTHEPTCAFKGKQGDNIFWPFNRRPLGKIVDWPTLVIETGVSESYQKLQQDARWWFENSDGRVRIVILLIVKKTYLRFEKWQLMPHNAPTPLPEDYLTQLRQQVRNVPPLAAQPAAAQRPYCAQEIKVTPDSVTGAPMIIPFEALYDRARGPTETDVVIPAHDFRSIAGTIF